MPSSWTPSTSPRRIGNRLAALEEDYEHLGRQLARRGVDIEALTERAHGLPGVGAFVGRGHRRHAVRALPRTRRAPQRLREARGLRGRLQARALDARHLAAHPLGQAGQPRRAAVLRRRRAGSSSTR